MNLPHKIRSTAAAAILTAAGLATSAHAEFCFSAAFSNIPSGGTASVQTYTPGSGTYPHYIGAITVSGSLLRSAAASRPDEAIIQVTAPSGKSYLLQPLRGRTAFTSLPHPLTGVTITLPASVSNYVFQLPVMEAHGDGQWTFRFLDTNPNSTTQADATWSNVSVNFGFEYEQPLADEVGALLPGRTATPVFSIAGIGNYPAHAKWFRFTLAEEVSTAGGKFLDIDTEPAGIYVPTIPSLLAPAPDVRIALYSGDGRLIAWDDNDGTGSNAQLTFGAGGRAAITGHVSSPSLAYDGRDGKLQPGIYYVAVRSGPAAFDPTFYATSYPESDPSSNIRVRFNTNTGGSLIVPRADFNRDGRTDVTDRDLFIASYQAHGG